MGKRKSARKPGAGKVKQAGLDKTFRCLFCQHNNTVTCKMDTKNRLGRLDCKDCGQNFTADINHLSAPIDVYSDWIDATEEVNAQASKERPSQPRRQPSPRLEPQRKRAAELVDDDDDEEELEDLDISKKKQKTTVEDEDEAEEVEERTARKGRVVESDDEDE